MTPMPRSFNDTLDGKSFEEDLEKYRELAIELGATDAIIIDKDDVIIDERIIARCSSPRCPDYGTNLHCPPYGWDIEETRKIVEKYQKGIFIKLEVSFDEMANADYDNPDKHRIPNAMKMYKIVSQVQSATFYDGYPYSLAFGGGPSCKRVFCPKVECSGLAGKGCRMGLKVNHTMHSIGMDPVAMAAKAGWVLYPIGKRTPSDQVPYGVEMGLVLVH
jgi:predicted metal-binding protein